MNDQKRIKVSEQIFDSIDDAYITELADFLMTEPKGSVQRGILWIVLAAVAVLALIVAGTVNILHYQNESDITARTERSTKEIEGQSIASSGNDAERTEASTVQDTEEETSSLEEESTLALREEELDAAIAALVEQICPERSEMYFEALAERYCGDGAEKAEIEACKNKVMEEFYTENSGDKICIYKDIEEYMKSGMTKAEILELLRQSAEEYPELTDEQEKEFNKRYNYYVSCYRDSIERELYDVENSLIAIAVYYDMIGRPEETLRVILPLTMEEAGALIDAEWSELASGDGVYMGEVEAGREHCYADVSIGALLQLLEAGNAPEILYVWEEVVFPGMPDGYKPRYTASTAAMVRLEKNYCYYDIIIQDNTSVLVIKGADE